MSFSFGFYNALNHDRLYDAIQVSEIFDGLIRDGVYSTIGDHYVVKASENENEVIVGSGRAWFDHTWNKNDADLPITAPLPDLLMKRYDALVIDINANVASRTNQITWVEGTPSLNTPVKPTLTNTTDHHQYPLCYILRTANNNTIIQDDIENTIGTDECPFVTGILQQVSISDLLLQWTSQFATFMNNNEATASAWEAEWEASMSQWTVEQKNEFATWMAGEKTEFDDWFANLHYILDGDVAGHLQNEIDAIEEGLGGSVFTIHTINSSLYGKTVTCTGSTQEKTAVFDASGNAEIKGITDVGTITFTATDGSQTATTQISVPYFSNYPITMAFWAATVNLSTTSEDLKGKTITIRKGGAVVGSTSFNAAGAATYTATSAGTYTFTCQGYSVEQAITEEATYNVSINSGLSLSAWITAGSTTDYPLNPSSYANFAALEADEEAIRQLMLVHNAVDYLATAGADDSLIENVINSDICAKWINLSDYALDTLSANANIKSIMDTADKYGYGEWGIVDSTTTPPTWGPLGNVPIMTANNAPYGEVISNGVYDNHYIWRCFDNDSSTFGAWNNAVGGYAGYKFNTPVKVKKVKVFVGSGGGTGDTMAVQASNDGSTWSQDLATFTYNDGDINIDIQNSDYYLYWRIVQKTKNQSWSGVMCHSLQFYGRELKPLVPTMTSNTMPKGRVFAKDDSNPSSSAPWHAFSGINSYNGGEWAAENDRTYPSYIGYESQTKIKVSMFRFWTSQHSSSTPGAAVKDFILQGSNDGSTWTDIYSGTFPDNVYRTPLYFISENPDFYKYHRIYILNTYGTLGVTYPSCGYIQFYGSDYSEKEFTTGSTRKTIYDHGVKFDTFSNANAYSSFVDDGNELQCVLAPTGSSQAFSVFADTAIDFTDYTQLVAKAGKKGIQLSFTNNSGILGIFSSKTIAYGNIPRIATSDYGISTNTVYENTIDTSSIQQTAYISVDYDGRSSAYTTKMSISELYLE